MFPYYIKCFLTDICPVIAKLNSHQITRNEAKIELDFLKECRKQFLNEEERCEYAGCTEFAKLMLDFRNDVPKYRIVVPYVDFGGRVNYMYKFYW